MQNSDYLARADQLHTPPYVFTRCYTALFLLTLVALLPILALPLCAYRQLRRLPKPDSGGRSDLLVRAVHAHTALRFRTSGVFFSVGWIHDMDMYFRAPGVGYE